MWRFDRTYETLRLVPPRQAEFLQAPINAAKAWLSGNAEVDVADVGQETTDTRVAGSCVRWGGFGKDPETIRISEIRPGDIILVDPSRGGIRAGTWDPSSTEPVRDLGDVAQLRHGRRATLRLDSRLLGDNIPARPGDEEIPDDKNESSSRSTRDRIIEWLQQKKDASEEQTEWFTKQLGNC